MEPASPLVAVEWRQAAAALADEVEKVTGLLRSVGDPGTPAMGQWNLAEVAMHLSQAWIIVPGMAADDLSAVHELLPHLKGTAGASLITDVWDLGETTMSGVDADAERDPSVLADRIEARAHAFLGALDDLVADTSHAWLVEGVPVTTTTLICHLLNETIVHGYDIARADGRTWPISRPHAAMVFDGFILPVFVGLGPRAMVDQQAAKGLRATYQLHFRGGSSYVFSFDDGALVIEQPGPRRVDCHISADPAAMLLVGWGRRSQWPAIARGQIVAWGRKPWLGPRFRSLVRNP
ncbi:MAG: maleylpyruvate isomerase N-terminal domain-containing protein [Acidimicrobiales bacterium]